MACYLMKPELTAEEIARRDNALKVLERKLAMKEVSVTISRRGEVAFAGWSEADRGGLADVCTMRKLMATNSPEFRRALAAAEARSGMKVDLRQQLASGRHSHDGGHTFHDGH